MGIELLNNNGIQYIGKKEALEAEHKTLIVIGVARGGTSLISGSLDHLGVFTGERSVQPVYEDVKLARALENRSFEEAQTIIEAYNNHGTWSFKRPSSIDYIAELNKLCRNPVYLIVFKDIFSISNRNTISMKSDVIKGLRNAHENYAKILSFISTESPNAFLLSYEKVMGNKEFFIDTLVDLIDKKKVSPSQRESALNFIEPNSKAYLDASRITKSIGEIGSVEKNTVVGWGKYLHSNEPATVELYINNVLVSSKKAKDFRQHTLDSKKHLTGYCGFIFDLSQIPLQNSDVVSVKLKDDVLFLKGSQNVYEE